MNIKRFETASTLWLVDEDLGRLQRIPKSEDPRIHSGWQYEGDWLAYEELIFQLHPDGACQVMLVGVEGHNTGMTWIPAANVEAARQQGFDIKERLADADHLTPRPPEVLTNPEAVGWDKDEG